MHITSDTIRPIADYVVGKLQAAAERTSTTLDDWAISLIRLPLVYDTALGWIAWAADEVAHRLGLHPADDTPAAAAEFARHIIDEHADEVVAAYFGRVAKAANSLAA